MNPIPAVTELDALGALEAPLSTNNGESLAISPLAAHPHLLLKRYRTGPAPADVERLDRLIALPADLVPDDRRTLATATCWPTARVVSGGATVGCVIPRAPAKFFTHLRGPQAPAVPLEIDWVSAGAHRRQRLGLPALDLPHRLRISANLLAVAALFERHDLVYADWSYANALWSARDGDVFVIDTDSCATGSRAAVKTANFDDPVPRPDALVDGDTDRYRVALLVARCLTGERDYTAVLGGLDRLPSGIRVLLDQTLTAARREDRAKIADLWPTVEAAAAVTPPTSWRPATTPIPPPARPRATPVRPRATPVRPTAAAPARVPAAAPPGSNVVGWTALPGRPAPAAAARPARPRRARWTAVAVGAALLLIVFVLIAAGGF
ncbi:hypothetical protein [Dactylosporangium sp. NPDC051541]|uniref:hypothetical protein n=1 Tax=Dactylosporangium sp. NPDC051541 TaxID=3363977 RepID=UPI0037A87C90